MEYPETLLFVFRRRGIGKPNPNQIPGVHAPLIRRNNPAPRRRKTKRKDQFGLRSYKQATPTGFAPGQDISGTNSRLIKMWVMTRTEVRNNVKRYEGWRNPWHRGRFVSCCGLKSALRRASARRHCPVTFLRTLDFGL